MILILGGTTEAVAVLAKLIDRNRHVTISTAYDFAASFIPQHERLRHISGKLDLDGLIELIKKENVHVVVDATHPYAEEISENARRACDRTGICYLRFERAHEPWEETDTVHAATSSSEAIRRACALGGTIFIAAGTNDAALFKREAESWGGRKKLFIRALPEAGSLERCKAAGSTDDEILTGVGPFSVEDNYTLWKKLGIDVVVTKESGSAGGFNEKLDAARRLGIHVVVMERPPAAAGANFDAPQTFSSVDEIVEAVLGMDDKGHKCDTER